MGFFDVIKDDIEVLKTELAKGATLIDVRTETEFFIDRMSGTINIPLDQIPAHLEALRDKKGIVLFCRSGARSAQAADYLKQNGITHVFNGGNRKVLEKLLKK